MHDKHQIRTQETDIKIDMHKCSDKILQTETCAYIKTQRHTL